MEKVLDRINELGKIIDQDNENQFLTQFERMRVVSEYCELVEVKGE